jgi:hypothetical protein
LNGFALAQAAAGRPVYQHVVEAEAGPNSVLFFIGTEDEITARIS